MSKVVGRRRWRAIDLGTVMVALEAGAPLVSCRSHGVVMTVVPWSGPSSRGARAFEDLCAWLGARTSQAATAELLRSSWRTVGAIVEWVVADVTGSRDLLAGVIRIGMDEIAHRKGHRCLVAVTDDDTCRLIWATPGRDEATVEAVFVAEGDHGKQLLAGWLAWAKRSQLAPFVKLVRTIGHYKPLILNTLDDSLSGARSEATNTHLRTLTRRVHGFHRPEALIAMAMLTRVGCCPPHPRCRPRRRPPPPPVGGRPRRGSDPRGRRGKRRSQPR